MRLGIFAIVVAIVGVGGLIWWNDGNAPYDAKDDTSISFTVQKGQSIREIASDLAQQKLIRSSVGFYIMVKLMGIERDIQAGDFRLKRNMDAKTVATSLTHGMEDVWVTTLEGWRVEEIATKLSQDLGIPEKEFLKYAREGYMFPDTYRIPKEASATAVVALFEENFNAKITVEMKDAVKKSGYTFDQVLALASLVEREGINDADRPMIAGILYNRLKKDWPLQVDATLQYILGYQAKEKSWWTKFVGDEDKKLDSLYNTYKYPGLPVGPISNPGFSAIKAAIYPAKSDYMYYLHDKNGIIHFAKTLEEHNANVSKYLQ